MTLADLRLTRVDGGAWPGRPRPRRRAPRPRRAAPRSAAAESSTQRRFDRAQSLGVGTTDRGTRARRADRTEEHRRIGVAADPAEGLDQASASSSTAAATLRHGGTRRSRRDTHRGRLRDRRPVPRTRRPTRRRWRRRSRCRPRGRSFGSPGGERARGRAQPRRASRQPRRRTSHESTDCRPRRAAAAPRRPPRPPRRVDRGSRGRAHRAHVPGPRGRCRRPRVPGRRQRRGARAQPSWSPASPAALRSAVQANRVPAPGPRAMARSPSWRDRVRSPRRHAPRAAVARAPTTVGSASGRCSIVSSAHSNTSAGPRK